VTTSTIHQPCTRQGRHEKAGGLMDYTPAMTAGQSSAVCSLSCSFVVQLYCTTPLYTPFASVLADAHALHACAPDKFDHMAEMFKHRVNRRHQIFQQTASMHSRSIPACRHQSLPASRTAQASRPLPPEGTTRHAVSASPRAAQTMRRPPAGFPILLRLRCTCQRFASGGRCSSQRSPAHAADRLPRAVPSRACSYSEHARRVPKP
jgi:hypothetical protein